MLFNGLYQPPTSIYKKLFYSFGFILHSIKIVINVEALLKHLRERLKYLFDKERIKNDVLFKRLSLPIFPLMPLPMISLQVSYDHDFS